MSVLIKGIDMPKDGGILCITIYPDGIVCLNRDLECKRIATAVPVPKHGRLIDGDVAEGIYFTEEDENGKDFCDGILYAADWISEQPTIIPAEPPEEEA